MYLKRVPATEQWMKPAESLLSKHQHTEATKTKQPSAEGSTGEAKLHLCHQTRRQIRESHLPWGRHELVSVHPKGPRSTLVNVHRLERRAGHWPSSPWFASSREERGLSRGTLITSHSEDCIDLPQPSAGSTCGLTWCMGCSGHHSSLWGPKPHLQLQIWIG